MPQLLVVNPSQPEPEWAYVDSASAPATFRDHDYVPTMQDQTRPIAIALRPGSRMPSDYVRSPDAAPIIVSGKFRQIIEELAPGKHGFLPILLLSASGEALAERHYMLKVQSFVDEALVMEESDLAMSMARVYRPSYPYPTKFPPRLMWKQSKVLGRHLWADAALKDHVVVSDEAFARMEAAGLKGFTAKESRIDPMR